ncbi:MAG: TonB-dependent receptor [Lewinellaceae bacterium]|nr:TonB-dependent receptor [Phaeodactylibacter sp.]MCB0615470.1 TonB-dependent receptor [Phaeodactylibacter sp.]MCB9346033.1 TonB-dependent receptor [Lewinellaceae bacterium]
MNIKKFCLCLCTALLQFSILFAQSTYPVGDTVRIHVDGVCGMCKERIENAALKTVGIRFANWDILSKTLMATRSPEPFDEAELHRNVSLAGHDTDKMNATDEAYESLHACCKYRNEAVRNAHRVEGNTVRAYLGGVVYEAEEKRRRIPLPGASIRWLNTNEGASTNEEGRFEMPWNAQTDQVVISFIGFGSDTIQVKEDFDLEIVLRTGALLSTVEVNYRRRTTETSFISSIKVQQIGEKELMKAACCNLSESFETNPSVDVSFTDAVTGARQIEMLGLSGPYVQITRENMPDVRGLSAIYGLTYTAGPWVESMQLNKGMGSVANGFESIAGQINVELRKPERGDRLYLNLYGNQMGRLEGNANLRQPINEHWDSGLLLHVKNQKMGRDIDRNDDGFMDMPESEQYIAVNRWKYHGDNGLEAQFGVKGAYIDDISGQHGGGTEAHSGHGGHWGARITTRRLEGWFKMGKVFPEKPYASLGFQLSGTYHGQDAYFGLRSYDAEQSSAYANLIYQSNFGDTQHQFKTGASFQWDQYDERLAGAGYTRNEWAPGGFLEYTYQPADQFTAVAGLRADYHNLFGAFLTPRLHLRYALAEAAVLRASAGRGQRTASIFAENIGALASARDIVIKAGNPEKPYGLDAEVAWNYGLNFTQGFKAGKRHGELNLDAFYTTFVNQVVVDYDRNPRELNFYNLQGRSYSTSLQAQVDMELLTRWDIRLAYRFNDVRVSYADGALQKPLVARHRAFINMAYETTTAWKFDFTLNWQGAKRIPSTADNPPAFQRPAYSPDFLLANAQISKQWRERFEIYLGAENLFDFIQADPIIANEDPFGPYFDSSLAWGPVFGRNVYVGLRYRIGKE